MRRRAAELANRINEPETITNNYVKLQLKYTMEQSLSTHFIILNLATTEAEAHAALGFSVLVLDTVHWLLRDRDCADL